MKKRIIIGLTLILTLSAPTSQAVSWKPWALASCVAATAFGAAAWMINKNEPSIKKLTEEITQKISALNQQATTIQSVLNTIQSNTAKEINNFLAQKLTTMPYEFTEELERKETIKKVGDKKYTQNEAGQILLQFRQHNKILLALKSSPDEETLKIYFLNQEFSDRNALNKELTQAAQAAQQAISNNLKTLHEKSTQKMRSLTREPYLKAAGISVLAMLGALWASWSR